jgi:ABC-2 type transport system permease protein
MITSLFVEIRKLKGSLALPLCGVAPTLVAVFLALVCFRRPLMDWPEAMEGSVGLWSFFVLPMTVTALATLVAQIEHGPRAWDHLLSLPVPRWRLFAAKSVVLMLAVAGMSLLLALELRLVDSLLGRLAPAVVPTGRFPWAFATRMLAGMWAASFCLAMVQLWVSLRYSSFVPGLTLGIAGTFIAVMANALPEGVYIPWMMPLNIMSAEPVRAEQALWLGVAGGTLALLGMIVHLGRREMSA